MEACAAWGHEESPFHPGTIRLQSFCIAVGGVNKVITKVREI
jgi:hypothetical protein